MKTRAGYEIFYTPKDGEHLFIGDGYVVVDSPTRSPMLIHTDGRITYMEPMGWNAPTVSQSFLERSARNARTWVPS